jgi:hypothetical protein
VCSCVPTAKQCAQCALRYHDHPKVHFAAAGGVLTAQVRISANNNRNKRRQDALIPADPTAAAAGNSPVASAPFSVLAAAFDTTALSLSSQILCRRTTVAVRCRDSNI